MRTLLELGASPRVKDRTGTTPLHCASLSGSAGCCEALLTAGADVSAQDECGFAASKFAASEEVSVLLLSRGK